MDNASIFARIKAFISKSAGDGLQVLGRTPATQDSGVRGKKSGPLRADGQGELDDIDMPSAEDRDGFRMIAEDDRHQTENSEMRNRPNEGGVSEGEVEDQELPSVNRRGGKGKLPSLLMMLTFGVFAFMVFAMMSGNKPPVPPPSVAGAQAAPSPAPEQAAVVNTLPPLVMPTAPAPLVAPQADPQVIPIQGEAAGQPQAQQAAVVDEPDWMTRKITSDVMLDPSKVKTKDLGGDAPSKDQANSKASTKTADEVAPQGELDRNLKSVVVTEGAKAGILPNRNFLIAKGTLLDCALETAIDSSLAGLVTCRLTRDVYSDNGRVIMLDRGSQLVGEYKSGIAEGMVRIFVLWTRAKTPKGVVVSLNSPGTDALGRTGLEGFVDTHFMERFGAAIMMSAVQMGFDYAKTEAQAKSTASTTNISSTSSSGAGGTSILDRIATEQLKKSVSIPPVLYINQGANVQVMVVRDLDFSTVYGVEEKE